MMETFIVLGLCFILYEALDFFQGCMHNTQPATSDRIESYRRQITEEKIRALQPTSPASSAPISPIIGNGIVTTPSSPKSTRFPSFPESSLDQRYHISSYHFQQQQEQQQQQQQQQTNSVSSSSASLPQQHTLNRQGSAPRAFLPANNTTNFSSLPRDYYYLQQQKHKNTTNFLSKFSSSLSDNRIFPEVCSASVATTAAPAATFDIIPPTAAAAPLVLDLKRAIFSGKKSSSLQERRSGRLDNCISNEECLSSNDDADDDDVDEDGYSCSSDNDEQVKRIFSISEKF